MTKNKVLVLFFAVFFFQILASEAPADRFILSEARLIHELQMAGCRILGYGQENGDKFIAVVIPVGTSIYEVCRSVSSLNQNYVTSRERIAQFNGVNPFYKRSLNGEEPATTKLEFIKIPLDAVGPAVPVKPRKPGKNSPPRPMLWRVYIS